MHEPKLATGRHDPLSLISDHEDQEGYTFNFGTVCITGSANTKHPKAFGSLVFVSEFNQQTHLTAPNIQPIKARYLNEIVSYSWGLKQSKPFKVSKANAS